MHFTFPLFPIIGGILTIILCIFLFSLLFKEKFSFNFPMEQFSILKYIRIFKKISLLLLIFTCFVIFGGPSLIGPPQEKVVAGINIQLVLDISKSMDARDISPTRLEAAKSTILEFISKLPLGNKIGVIVFAGKAFSIIPMTTDYDLIKTEILKIETNTLEHNFILQGTATGDALLKGLYNLDKARKASKNKNANLLVMLTDGERNKGFNPLVVAPIIKEQNINFFLIGVAKKQATTIEYIDPDTGNSYLLREPDGKVIYTFFNPEHLKQIAKLAGGEYVQTTNKNLLNSIFSKIHTIVKEETVIKEEITFYDISQYFIWILVFLVIIILI